MFHGEHVFIIVKATELSDAPYKECGRHYTGSL